MENPAFLWAQCLENARFVRPYARIVSLTSYKSNKPYYCFVVLDYDSYGNVLQLHEPEAWFAAEWHDDQLKALQNLHDMLSKFVTSQLLDKGLRTVQQYHAAEIQHAKEMRKFPHRPYPESLASTPQDADFKEPTLKPLGPAHFPHPSPALSSVFPRHFAENKTKSSHPIAKSGLQQQYRSDLELRNYQQSQHPEPAPQVSIVTTAHKHGHVDDLKLPVNRRKASSNATMTGRTVSQIPCSQLSPSSRLSGDTLRDSSAQQQESSFPQAGNLENDMPYYKQDSRTTDNGKRNEARARSGMQSFDPSNNTKSYSRKSVGHQDNPESSDLSSIAVRVANAQADRESRNPSPQKLLKSFSRLVQELDAERDDLHKKMVEVRKMQQKIEAAKFQQSMRGSGERFEQAGIKSVHEESPEHSVSSQPQGTMPHSQTMQLDDERLNPPYIEPAFIPNLYQDTWESQPGLSSTADEPPVPAIASPINPGSQRSLSPSLETSLPMPPRSISHRHGSNATQETEIYQPPFPLGSNSSRNVSHDSTALQPPSFPSPESNRRVTAHADLASGRYAQQQQQLPRRSVTQQSKPDTEEEKKSGVMSKVKDKITPRGLSWSSKRSRSRD